MNKNLKSVEIYANHIEMIYGLIEDCDSQLKLIKAIVDFQMYGVLPDYLNNAELLVWNAIFPSYNAKMKRRLASIENGKKGGAPKGNQNAVKKNAVESHETPRDDKVISKDIKVAQIEEKQPLNESQDITPQSKIVNDNPIIENSVYKKVYGRAFARNKEGNIYPLEEDRLKAVFEELTDNIYQDAFKNIKSRMNNKTFDYVSANYGNFNFMYN